MSDGGNNEDLGPRRQAEAEAPQSRSGPTREALPPTPDDDDDKPVGLNKPKLKLADFYAYALKRNYIFATTGEFWPRGAVDDRVERVFMGYDSKGNPIYWPASVWLDKNKMVEQLTWAPGEPQIVEHRLVVEGGWIKRLGCHVFNLYVPPQRKPGNPRKAALWVRHVHKVYGRHTRHIIGFLAHRIQKPEEKINHGLVLGGSQGIGKDTLLEPIKHGIGPWNFKDVAPKVLLGRFNPYLKSVILRISEARDLGEISRYDFYDATKTLMAAPPDVLQCDEKNIREHPIFNLCGVIVTTNYLTGGIYLPLEDRRHYVAWSDLKKEDFFIPDDNRKEPDPDPSKAEVERKAYWNRLWKYYDAGGIWDVVAYLKTYDLKKNGFDPKAPPPKTKAWWAIVTSSMAPEDAEIADILDQLGNPKVVTLREIINQALANLSPEQRLQKNRGDIAEYLQDRRNSRLIPHRMEACGYTALRNDGATDGLWKVRDARQRIYMQAGLTEFEGVKVAKKRYRLP
jgi:hypothetical protein